MKPISAVCVAIVEDDAILREELACYLSQQGFEVLTANSGRGLDDLLPGATVHVVILDLNLPGENGFQIAERIRQHARDMGIIMLTARSALLDRVKGYECGADIYLAKPVPEQELRAAILSLSRRVCSQQDSGAWQLDPEHGMIRPPSGEPAISLTPKETAFLLLFARAAQSTLDSADMCEMMGMPQVQAPLSKRALENIASRLRKKLQVHPAAVTPMIRPVWGTGYQLCFAITQAKRDEPRTEDSVTPGSGTPG